MWEALYMNVQSTKFKLNSCFYKQSYKHTYAHNEPMDTLTLRLDRLLANVKCYIFDKQQDRHF